MTDQHITAHTTSPDGERVDMVVDTHTGAFVSTGEVGADVTELMDRFGDMMGRMNPETGEFDTTGMTAEELATVDRINAKAAELDAQQAAEQED